MESGFSWAGFIESVNLFASIIVVFGIPFTVLSLYKRQLRSIFSTVCRSPAPEVAKYNEVHDKIFSYYTLDSSLFVIDIQYLSESIEKLYNNKIKFDMFGEHNYKFPLICEEWWLKSKCPNLLIKNCGLEKENNGKLSEGSLSDDKLKMSTNFLNLFQIENYPDFLGSISNKEMWNGRTFDLCKIDPKPEIKALELHFILGRYFNYVKYYDLIAKELYFHLYIKRSEKFLIWLLKPLLLKFRVRESLLKEQIFEFKGRPVKLGINVFVLMKKDENKYCTFIQKRGELQVEQPGFYSVAPAGAFQPLSDFHEKIIEEQCHFQYTVLREFLEEVYDLEEADWKNRSADPFNIFRLEKRKNFTPGKYLLTDEEIKNRDIPSKKDNIYEIIPTGFLIDLVTLKPELTVLLLIKDIEVYRKSKEIIEGKENIEGNWEGHVLEFDIESDDFAEFLNKNLNINNFSPAGAVALAEGLHYYFTTIKKSDT